MIKLLFLKSSELEQVVSEIMQEQDKNTTCRIDFSEKLQTDIVVVQYPNSIDEISLNDLLEDIGKKYNENIKSYDVFEVGDYGEGYAFFIG